MRRSSSRSGRCAFVRGGLALASLGLLSGCATLPIGPQRRAGLPRVGYLAGGGQERADGFRLGLTDHGYVEGRNIAVEWRDSEGWADRLPGLAAELVGLPVDVLVADGTSATRALVDATDAIPIVMAQSASPVEDGFVASLARPGGNVTGLTSISRELLQKRLELRSLEARDAEALGAAFERASAERVDGLFVIDSPVLVSNAPRVGELARQHRLPVNAANRPLVVAGGLLAYSADRPAMYRRAGGYVDRILKGADPAEMPVERPTTFDLVINLGTARELSLTIPPSVLQQATELIR